MNFIPHMTETIIYRNIDLSCWIALDLVLTFDLQFMAKRILFRSAKTELAFLHKERPAWYAAFGYAFVEQPAWHCDSEHIADCFTVSNVRIAARTVTSSGHYVGTYRLNDTRYGVFCTESVRWCPWTSADWWYCGSGGGIQQVVITFDGILRRIGFGEVFLSFMCAAFVFRLKAHRSACVITLAVLFRRVSKMSCLSVRPSVRVEQLVSHCTDFREIWYWSIFQRSVEQIQFWLKSDRNKLCSIWRPVDICDRISLILVINQLNAQILVL